MSSEKQLFLPIVILSAFLASGQTVPTVDDPNLFRSEVARLELSKPEGWHFLDIEAVARHRGQARLKDEELQQAILQMASAPLVVASKHPEPHHSLNPSFQVLVRPLGGLTGSTGVEILSLIVPNLSNALEAFELLKGPEEFLLGGLPAARLTATYTVSNPEGEIFPTKTLMAVAPRGSYMYQFSFSAPPDGEDALNAELVQKVFASVRFLD
jgi:hypothetical protein